MGMGYCKVHPNVELNMFDVCPVCAEQQELAREEERRHKELSAEAQRQHDESMESQEEIRRIAEEQLEESRLFAAQQYEIAQQQAYQTRLQTDAAQEALRIQRAHIADQKATLKVEEERRELRTGLAEFSEDFRSKWKDINYAKEDLEREDNNFRTDMADFDAASTSAKENLQNIEYSFILESETKFKAMLEEERKSGNASTERTDKLANILNRNNTILTLYKSILTIPLMRKAHMSLRPRFKPLNRVPLDNISGSHSLLCSLEDISDVQEHISLAEIVDDGKLLNLWLGSIIGSIWTLWVTKSFYKHTILTLHKHRHNVISMTLGDKWLCILLLISWGSVLTIIYFAYYKHIKQNIALKKLRKLSDEYVKSVNEIIDKSGAREAIHAWEEKVRIMSRIRQETRERFIREYGYVGAPQLDWHDSFARHNPNHPYLSEAIYNWLLNEYRGVESQHPDHIQKISAAKHEIDTIESRRHEREARFKKENPNAEQIPVQYNYMYGEIRRVGSEIIRGLRVPDRKITAQDCPKCSGPVTSESRKCPYCGVGLSF